MESKAALTAVQETTLLARLQRLACNGSPLSHRQWYAGGYSGLTRLSSTNWFRFLQC